MCLLTKPLSPAAAYKQCYERADAKGAHVVFARDLVAGDRVLTATPEGVLSSTYVVANQHKAFDTTATMLTLHTATGSVSMTPDHAGFVDGMLVAAYDAQVGAFLTDAVQAVKKITHVTKGEGAIINPVTTSGTILVSDHGAAPVLAATNPYWVARITIAFPTVRAIVNAALYIGGDVDSLVAGIAGVLGKIIATCAVVGTAGAALTGAALKSRKATSA